LKQGCKNSLPKLQLKFEQNDASGDIAKLDWARMKFAGGAHA